MSARLRQALTLASVGLLLCGAAAAQSLQWRVLPDLTVRGQHSMASDPIRGRVVLFGGGNAAVLLNDTWEWDGSQWERMWPAQSPSPRIDHEMVWDPVSQRVILIGGDDGRVAFSDMWAWDGRSWTLITPSALPSGCTYAAVGADPVRNRLLLFGGGRNPGGVFGFGASNETWEWDGTLWRQLFPATVPDPRAGAQLARAKNGRLLLVGGSVLATTDIFEWTGSDWVRRANVGTPSTSATVFDMAEDPRSGDIVLYVGSFGVHIPNSTYVWDGVAWVSMLPSSTPEFRSQPRLATDWAKGQVILFGEDNVTVEPERDTWGWDGTTWRQVHDWASPCDGLVGMDEGNDEIVVLAYGCTTQSLETWTYSDAGFQKKAPTRLPTANVGWSGMAYHRGARRLVLYGGTMVKPGGLYSISETWLWDGTDWTQHPIPSKAPGGSGHLLYDSARDKLVLVPVQGYPMWEWDPLRGWRAMQPMVFPPAWVTAAAYDSLRRRIVACVQDPSSGTGDALWEFDGTAWIKATPRTIPPKGCSRLLRDMPSAGGVVAFGAVRSMTDTWLWDGQDWSQLAATLPFMNVSLWTAVADPGRQRIVAIYPFLRSGPAPALWELSAQPLTTSQRYPRPGEQLTLSVSLPTQASTPFVLGLSHASWPGIPLRLGLSGTTDLLPLAAGPVLDLSLGAGLTTVLDSQGAGSFTLAVPGAPYLIGLRVAAAGFTVGGGPSVGAITNAMPLSVIQ